MADSVRRKLKILFAASEAVPFAKSGGLGDVAGSLPRALKHAGAKVAVKGGGKRVKQFMYVVLALLFVTLVSDLFMG